VEDVERLICSSALRFPAFRLVREGAVLEPDSYTVDLGWSPKPFSGTIDVDRVLAEWEDGATIVLQALHHNWGPVATFCRGLEAALGEPIQANAYFTPRSAQGLAVHHDTHDVFVLQLAGKKHWRVYEPVVELPLQHQKYSRARHGEPGAPVEDCVLEPGDTMYLPRGWLHDALTTDSESLHLTIGVKVYTWLDAVKGALDECGDDVGYRRSVSEDGQMQDDLLAVLADLLAPEQVAERKRRRFLKSRRPVPDGQLSQLRALDGLTVETPLMRRETVLAELDFPDLSFEGKTITFPEHVEEEVEFVVDAEGELTAAGLPGGLDNESRLVLVRRLVREGFLRIAVRPSR
jgi:JmjC domain